MEIISYPDFLTCLISLILVSIAFVRLCVFKSSPALGTKGGIAILLLAGVFAVSMWSSHMLKNEVITAIYAATVIILVITGIYVWIGSKRNTQGTEHSKTSSFPVQDSIAPLFSKGNTLRWQLIVMVYILVAVLTGILVSKNYYSLPDALFYFMLGAWVLLLVLGCAMALRMLSHVNPPEESATRSLLKLVSGFLLGLLGLGSSQSWWLMMMDKETVLKNRKVVQQKNLQMQLFLGVGIWLVWGICSGGLIGFEHAHYFAGVGLFSCIFFPVILIAIARFKGFFP